MANNSYYKRRKSHKRNMAVRRFISITVMLLILILTTKLICSKFTRRKYDLSSLSVPDYVKAELLDNNNARTGIPMTEVNDIVIHYTANPGTSAQNNRDYFNQETTEVCSHFIIDISGEIIQCVPLNEKSSASNNRNRDTVSIEVCHEDASGKFSDAAYNSLIKLTAWLCKSVDLNEKHIIRHYDITGKLCPLYYVENEDKWEQLKTDVKKEMKK